MKKILAWYILIAFLLTVFTACSQVKESIRPSNEITLPKINEEIAAKSSIVSKQVELKLYFLSLSQTSLVTENRTVTLSQDENVAKRTVSELILGSKEYGHTQIDVQGVSVQDVLVNKDIASVYLTAGSIPENEKRYYFECTIVNTLINLLDVTYVNVFWNGRIEEENIFGLRAVSKDNIAQEYIEKSSLKADSTDTATEENVAVYFASSDYSLYLPEVKNISVENKDYITTLFDALQEGSNEKNSRADVFSDDIKLLTYSIDDLQGENIVTLILDKMPLFFNYQDSDSINAFYASLVLTLTANIPKIDGMRIISTRGQFESEIIKAKDFISSHGSEITVFLQKAGEDELVPVKRIINTNRLYDIKSRIEELLKGPATGEAQSVLPVFPSGVSEEDILDAYVVDDIAYISLSQNFYDRVSEMSDQNGRLLIFSIIGTAAQTGIEKVRFLIEGKSVSNTVATINLSNSLLENPGLISGD